MNVLQFVAGCKDHGSYLRLKQHYAADLSSSVMNNSIIYELHWAAFRCTTGEQTCREAWYFTGVKNGHSNV